jgi:DNA repair protein RadC
MNTSIPSISPTIQSLRPADRPREKLLAKGEAYLTNQELLQVVIGSGVAGADVTKISSDILVLMEQYNGKPTMDQLLATRGVSVATASKLLASLELTGRFNHTGKVVMDEDNVLELLADIRNKPQEHFVVLTLDGANRLIEKRVITIGTLNASLVHPREVFADAITDRAAGIVVAHNHPGGTLEPSGPDIIVTKRLRAAGEMLGIRMLDHIIVTATSHCIVELAD